MTTTTHPTKYGLELGIDVPGEGRVCAVDIGGMPDLTTAMQEAENLRGKPARVALCHDAWEACRMDSDPSQDDLPIVGATVYAYDDHYGTTWSHDLIEWEAPAERRAEAARIAARIADEYTDRYAADAYHGDELQMVRGVIEDAATAAALAALEGMEAAS